MSAMASSNSQEADKEPIWVPSKTGVIPMNKYREHINSKFRQDLRNSQQLHRWSVTNPQQFWIDLYEYVGIIPALPAGTTKAYDESLPISSVPKFFENVQINYAENVLSNRDLNATALIGLREGQGLEGEKWTWRALTENVRVAASALKRSGVKEGDRIGALMSNSVWTIGLFLAAASMGVVFTSINPDLGDEGCITRLSQVTPKILFAESDVTYKGRQTSIADKISTIVSNLSEKPEVFIIPLSSNTPSFPVLDKFLARSSSLDKLQFTRLSFSYPLYILYSSGTTGAPKCLVHQHGVILQLKKVALLHNSLTPKDMVFQYSSTSWVLWNIMNGHLSVGATCICYDGSPLFPDPAAMLKILERYKVTYWGTSPRYLLELEMWNKVVPKKDFDLSSLRMVTTTGASLMKSQFHWFYKVFPPRVHLSSIAGGTDIVTSWIASDPAGPLYPPEMQLPGLGQDVDVADTETGESIKHTGRSGELVCRKPFPSMPVYLWGDKNNEKYKSSYFERFENIDVWAQHDWIHINPATGGVVMHGRSDGVLNPSGIRFGSSEVYSIVEGPLFNSTISSTLCIGRQRPLDHSEQVFLFVLMRPGHPFTPELQESLRAAIRKGLSPRHVPRFIFEVKEIPVTVNGKKIETLVKKIICEGKVPGKVSSTVSNPGCLQSYVKYYKFDETRAKL